MLMLQQTATMKRKGVSAYGTFKRAKKSYMTQRATASRRTTQRATSAASTALRRLVEVKGLDTGVAGAIPGNDNTNAGGYVLNLAQQGTGSWNRVGRKINMKSIRLMLTFENQVTVLAGNAVGNWVRYIVVYDRQPNSGAIPRFDDIFGVTDQTGAESTLPAYPLRYDAMDRFKVIRDATVEMQTPTLIVGAAATSNTLTQYKKIDDYIPLRDLETVYSGQSNPLTSADISTGTLLLYVRAQTRTVGVNTVELDDNAVCRLRYMDV